MTNKHLLPIFDRPMIHYPIQCLLNAGIRDVLIVTGSGTGQPTDPARLKAVREAAPHAPVWVGSGVTLETAAELGRLAHGAIVGTALHQDGDLSKPLDEARVRAMVAALRAG